MTGAAILGLAGTALTPREAAFFRQADPWGFILFARNIDTPVQVAALTASLRAAVGRDAPIFIDQEGGRVQRLRSPHWREWDPPMEFVARAGAEAARALWLRYRLIAAELRAVGIDANCAPCLDVAGPDTHPFLRNRCLSERPAEVARLGRAVADGLLAGGVLPVIKHIPGHGRATVDSHKGLPRVDAPRADLEADLAPFRALADLPLGMTAHVVYDAVDPGAPATTSAKAIGLIRDAVGFDGLLMTDDIGMGALSGSVADRAAAAMAAGCDVILHCNGDMPEMEAVVTAAGALSAASQRRAEAACAARRLPDAVDIAALDAELQALTQGGGAHGG